jgi:hypothetical protein
VQFSTVVLPVLQLPVLQLPVLPVLQLYCGLPALFTNCTLLYWDVPVEPVVKKLYLGAPWSAIRPAKKWISTGDFSMSGVGALAPLDLNPLP